MYCKNCGNPVDEKAAICVKCGVSVGGGNKFCANCGNSINEGAAVCMSCGHAVTSAMNGQAINGSKSKVAAGILGIFLGSLGIHNFYLGYTKKAVIQLVLSLVGGIFSCIGGSYLTGAVAIWGIIEGVLILCGSINTDADGVPLSD